MRIFSDLNEINGISGKTAVAIGKFDGLHLGHARLFEEVKNKRRDGFSSLVFTFDKPIADYFSGEYQPLLSTNSEKEEYLRDLGIDYEFVLPVNKETVAIEPSEFIRFLSQDLNMGFIAAGNDISFGDGGKGDIELLRSLSSVYGYEVCEVEKVKLGDETVSSTMIRQFIQEGRMELAQAALGRPYSIDGMVRQGRKLGRTLEMPTVNLETEDNKLLPPFGVYFSYIYLGTGVFRGITNIGVRPTVTDEGRVTVETYIYDFDDDVYGEWLKVELLHFLRSEKKFNDMDALKAQMRTDMLRGRIYFS